MMVELSAKTSSINSRWREMAALDISLSKMASKYSFTHVNCVFSNIFSSIYHRSPISRQRLNTISIIIPILNEAACIGRYRDTWLQWTSLEGLECIFVDGGSSDQSVDLLREVGLTVLHSKPSRAQQMNLGASEAQGALLMFLHADTDIDNFESKLQLLRHQFEGSVDQDLFWGFCHISITGESLTLYQKAMFKCVGELINIRSKVTGICTGDQLQFISQQLFQRIGGFPKMPLLEDVQFCKNLKGIATPTMMPWGVHTSGRRWLKNGIWFTILYMWKIRFQFWRGDSAHSLASSYKSVR